MHWDRKYIEWLNASKFSEDHIFELWGAGLCGLSVLISHWDVTIGSCPDDFEKTEDGWECQICSWPLCKSLKQATRCLPKPEGSAHQTSNPHRDPWKFARCDDVPCTTCFTRLAPYPASAKALKVPDIQRSKPGNPRRKKKSETTLRNHELENKNSTKISSEKCQTSTDSRCQRTTHRPILGMERLGTRVQNLHWNTMAFNIFFFKEKKEDGVPPVEEDLWAGSLSPK